MQTKLISIREFFKHGTKLLRTAQEEGIYYIVMRHSTPVARITPIISVDLTDEISEVELTALRKDVQNAKEEYKQGETLSSEEMLQALGL
jgi:antitoxin (DNA-binding transcriptional repressor) of toxin-antitoxin stability system